MKTPWAVLRCGDHDVGVGLTPLGGGDTVVIFMADIGPDGAALEANTSAETSKPGPKVLMPSSTISVQ